MYSDETTIITQNPNPTQDSTTVVSGNDLWGSGAVEVVSGTVLTWTVDDTELPLDQNEQTGSGTDEQTDPEVEEIIDLLEELIAENETK